MIESIHIPSLDSAWFIANPIPIEQSFSAGINTFNGTVELNACVEDSNGVCGTVGQVLTSTGSATLWTNGGGVGLQNLSQVLTVGNTATNDIILNGTIQPTTITDSTSSVGLAGQILTSNGTGLTWVNAACCNSALLMIIF